MILAPRSGALIRSFTYRGDPVLAGSRAGADFDPTQGAMFVMLPWCNRLSAGVVAAAELADDTLPRAWLIMAEALEPGDPK